MSLQNSKCDRCGEAVQSLRMSIFNQDMLCEECLKKERLHPMYEIAKEMELQAVRSGNYNFSGIGKPEDL